MLDPLPGTILRVLTSDLNAASSFWAQYQGFTAHLVQVDPDGLWSIAIDEPAAIGWLSSISGSIVLGEVPPGDTPVVPDPHHPVEVWTRVDLPARYNPVPAVKPARLQIIGLPPALPRREGLAKRILRFITGNR